MSERITVTDRLIAIGVLPLLPSFVRPNHITAFRFGMIPFVMYFFATGELRLGIVAFALAAFSDAVDGALARTSNQITEWGKMYDPVADKLLIGSAAALVVSNYLGHKLALSIITLELLIVAFAFYRKRFKGRDIAAKKVGKIKMVLQSVGILLLLFYAEGGAPALRAGALYFLYAAVVFAILSLFVYRSI